MEIAASDHVPCALDLWGVTGTIAAGSKVLLVEGSLPDAVRHGSYLGIAGAGATDPISQRYFPTPSLRAMVLERNGNRLALDVEAAVSVAGAQVTIDTAPTLQRLLDELRMGDGGVLRLGEGVYVIGVPGAKDNAPLFVGSNTRLVGAGVDATILRVCDRAAQCSVSYTSKHQLLGGVVDAGYQYPCAAAIANWCNQFWHHQEPWPSVAGMIAGPPDHDIVIEHMTVDGNSHNQPANFVPGNRTRHVLPDGRSFAHAVAVACGPDQSTLTPHHWYDVAIRFANGNGQEASGVHTSVLIPEVGHHRIVVTAPTPPRGASRAFLYVRDLEADPIGTTWTYGEWVPRDSTAMATVWERREIPLPAPGEQLTISEHRIPDANENTYPPGLGLIGHGAASGSYGISLDNVTRVELRHLKITNLASDGLVIGNATVVEGEHWADNVTVQDIEIVDCGRGMVGIVGPTRNLLIERMTGGRGCYWGIDVELAAAEGGLLNMILRDSEISHCWQQPAIQLAAFQSTPLMGIVIERCLFHDCGSGIAGSRAALGLLVRNCTFSGMRKHAAIGINALARAFILDNTFIFNGRDCPPPPDAHTGEVQWGSYVFGAPWGGVSSIVCIGNRHVIAPTQYPTWATSQPGHTTMIDGDTIVMAREVEGQEVAYVGVYDEPGLYLDGSQTVRVNVSGRYRRWQ